MMLTPALRQAISRAIDDTMDCINGLADTIADELNADNAEVRHAIMREIHDSTLPPGELDGRTARWRCRFRIYSAENDSEPVADSDAELDPGAPGSMVIAGLPAVALEARALAQSWHGARALLGLSREETDKRLRGLRPTLSRRGGNAVWRLPYDTLETFNERDHTRGWLMRVDIVRESTGEST